MSKLSGGSSSPDGAVRPLFPAGGPRGGSLLRFDVENDPRQGIGLYEALVEQDTRGLADSDWLDRLEAIARLKARLAALEAGAVAGFDDALKGVSADLGHRYPQWGDRAAAAGERRWVAGDLRSVADEVALILEMHRGHATTRIHTSCELVHNFPATLQALMEGRLTERAAFTIVRELSVLADFGEMRAAEAAMLDWTRKHSLVEIKRECRREVARRSPAAVEEAYQRAHEERSVQMYTDDLGRADIVHNQDAVEAAAVMTSLTRAATHRRRHGDNRTLDQLRADIALERLLPRTKRPSHTPATPTSNCAPANDITHEPSSDISRESSSGTSREKASDSNYEPAEGANCAPADGLAHESTAGTECEQANGTEREQTSGTDCEPAEGSAAGSTGVANHLPEGHLSGGALADGTRQEWVGETPCDPTDCSGGDSAGDIECELAGEALDAPVGIQPTVVIHATGAEVLALINGEVATGGEADHHGPIPQSSLRKHLTTALAQSLLAKASGFPTIPAPGDRSHHASTTTATTDAAPASGARPDTAAAFRGSRIELQITDQPPPSDPNRYLPSAALDRYIRLRDRTCQFPGCNRPAEFTDIDHRIAFAAGGRTTAANLWCLCRHHHRLKHEGGWQIVSNTDGTHTWISPTGRQYPGGAVVHRQRSPRRKRPGDGHLLW